MIKAVHGPQSTVHSTFGGGQAYAHHGSWTAVSNLVRRCRGLWTVDRGLPRISLGCFLIIILLTFASCGSDPEPEFPDTYRQDVITYFDHVALGFEFGDASEVTRKWNTDMKLFIGGKPPQYLRDELDRIITELNDLTAADGFNISITPDTTRCNAYAYFGTSTYFSEVYNAPPGDIRDNLGLFYVKYDNTNHFYSAIIFVDLERTTDNDVRKHLLREELTQSLGLARDSYEYPASIFQQAWTSVTDYAPIDRDLIRLLYNPGMSTGLDAEHVQPVLEQLTNDLKIGNP